MITKLCRRCGAPLAPTMRSHAVYCTARCRRAATKARQYREALVGRAALAAARQIAA